jgi:capsular exopolysaccharide synthesis family protein
VEFSEKIQNGSSSTDSIDFSKLGIILRNNWMWIVLIFVIVNSAAYLIIRYTKNVYESESEIKLDINTEASEFGIQTIVEDQNLNILAGEIEIIQSRLFLNRIIDQSNFEVSFISVGRVLNDEMFRNTPAFIRSYNEKHSYYNTPIYYTEQDINSYILKIGNKGEEISGKYGQKVTVGDLSLVLDRNKLFQRGDEIGYYFIINSKEVLLDYLIKNLTAEPLNYNANTLRISFKDHNPFKAQAVLNKIDSTYLLYSNEQKSLANTQKIDWLTNELHHIESRMEDYENYFETFTLQNKTNNLDADLVKTIQAINLVDSQRYELTRRINESDRLFEALNKNSFTTPVAIRNALPDVLNKSIEQVINLQMEQEKLKLSYNEITFAYRKKEKEIEILKEKTLEQLAELKGEWQRRLQELNQRKTSLESDFAHFPDKHTEFSKNQRFYKLYEQFYLTLMQSKSEFEIAQAGTIPEFKILSPASLSAAPISPNRLMIAGIGIVMSLVVNFFFIGILYLINNKITAANELERGSSAPLLGTIPSTRNKVNEGLHVLDFPKSMVSEAIRSIRTNLDFVQVSTPQKVITISSTVSGEGKSFIAMNLGGVLALSKKKVILIDLDMRKQKHHLPANGIDTSKGISTILIRKHKWIDCVSETGLENFHFIPAGPQPPNPSELLLNGEFTDLISSLKQHYDYIILDTPPVGLVTDGIMAMRKADICIYIFRANYSKREFVNNLQRIISINKISNITTLLNAVPSQGKTYGYGYYEENGHPQKKKKSLLKA